MLLIVGDARFKVDGGVGWSSVACSRPTTTWPSRGKDGGDALDVMMGPGTPVVDCDVGRVDQIVLCCR